VPQDRAHRYAAWLDSRRVGVLLLAAVVAIGCGYIGSKIAIRTDLTKLLPESTRSVQDLAAISARARPVGSIHVVVESQVPALRDRAGTLLRDRLAKFPSDQVVAFSSDDSPLYRFAWDHRFMLAKLDDLTAARDALERRLERAKLKANPLYIDLGDDDAPDPSKDRLADLEREVLKLEARANTPPRRVSPDGKLELLTLQTAFPVSSYDKTRALIDAVETIVEGVLDEVGPGVEVGLAGNATQSLQEHDSVLTGLSMSIVLALTLVALGLLFYYRSPIVVLAMVGSLLVGVALTFAYAKLAVGYLDMMSAFLVAIVVGNGINAGLIFVARYFEEIRSGKTAGDAVGPAIGASLPGTLAATATAAIAYGSLVITDFRGFRNFGEIAGVGMLATLLTTFTVLPALLFVLARHDKIQVTPEPPKLGRVLARMYPKTGLGYLVLAGALITAGATVVAVRYIAGDPFTKDWRDLQSSTRKIEHTREIGNRAAAAFASGGGLSGVSYQVVLAVDHRDQLAPLAARIKAEQALRPPHLRWFRDIRSLDELLPPDQDAKLGVLGEIRRLIDDPALQASLDAKDRDKLLKVRPPDVLKKIVEADVPHDLSWPFIERDGSAGRLAVLRGAQHLDSFNVSDRLWFANEVRALQLPPGTLVAGEALVVADVIATMEKDAPWMIGFALLGSIIGVIVIVGWRRHGIVTLACGISGVVLFIALCALAGVTVHFVDLIALPITIGIGIDYAVNLATREREEGEKGPHHLLETTGGAVVLCSYTTSVGYASLLLSANGGIVAFGLAALLGELACVFMAVLVAPALFAMLRRRR
jgi:hypothetical protein